ncbi:MAG: hypothetical protein R2705_00250 [Ilumatobacteraceae bacterium]
MPKRGEKIRVKKQCCDDRPRCKDCPVLWRRLARQGCAERTAEREFVVLHKIRKSAFKELRASTR